MKSAVAYYRVSMQRQGRSGLGLEAQRTAVVRFAESEGIAFLAEFTEVETGKGAMRFADEASHPASGSKMTGCSEWPINGPKIDPDQ